MAASAAGGSGSELLTHLQDQVDAVSRKFFESVGVMQRDAPPYAAPGGPPLAAAAPTPGFDVQANAQRMAGEITEQVQLTEQLLQLLPDGLGCTSASSSSNGLDGSQGGGSRQHDAFTAEVRALQQQHAEVSQQLQAAVGEVEGELLQLQLLYATLAKAKLQAQAQARSA